MLSDVHLPTAFTILLESAAKGFYLLPKSHTYVRVTPRKLRLLPSKNPGTAAISHGSTRENVGKLPTAGGAYIHSQTVC